MPPTCPPGGPAFVGPIINLNDPESCVTALNDLLRAYYASITGHQRVTTRFQERWTEYAKASPDLIRQEYMLLYRQFPAAKAMGFPDLSEANRVRRGAPARGMNVFPRL